ncbi:MAG: hypothetical protein GF418_00190 [Chitinivibrionales bacterium]|nr:hypothetical protein [Chitinivibrionales bacterium]MBD3394018.1 hypothetical protein [Chitinivibrionales bacterium]
MSMDGVNINDLLSTGQSGEAYKARASISGGKLDASSTTFEGDRNDALFAPKKELEKMDFLRLLVAQLQFQDPMEPMDNTTFVAELAQFSALEGNLNIEKAISKLDNSFKETVEAQDYSAKSMTNASAVSLIGKEVRLQEKQVNFYADAGEKVPVRVHVGNHAEAVVEITDSDGNVVRTLTASDKDAENSATVYWDGMTDSGEFAGRGSYAIHIKGEDKDPGLYAYVQDVVQGVRFSQEGPLVKIGGKELSIGNIMDVSMGAESKGFESLSPTSAVSLLGKNVRVIDDSLSYVNKGDATAPEIMDIKAYVGSLPYGTLEIVDSAGNVVFRDTAAAAQDGSKTAVFHWDGRHMDTFDFVNTGEYGIRLVEAGRNPDVYLFQDGTVDGVSNLASGTQIRVNGENVPLSAILDISNQERVQEDV